MPTLIEEMKSEREIIESRQDGYFGLCPIDGCDQNLQYLNIGRDHYMVCHDHKTFWPIGSNLFSSWQEETQAVWEENQKKLSTFKKVEPRNEPIEYD